MEKIKVRCLEAKDESFLVGAGDLVNESEMEDTDQDC